MCYGVYSVRRDALPSPLRTRVQGLLLTYASSVLAGGVAHQTYVTPAGAPLLSLASARDLNTPAFRNLWTVCVGSVCLGVGALGSIATQLSVPFTPPSSSATKLVTAAAPKPRVVTQLIGAGVGACGGAVGFGALGAAVSLLVPLSQPFLPNRAVATLAVSSAGIVLGIFLGFILGSIGPHVAVSVASHPNAEVVSAPLLGHDWCS